MGTTRMFQYETYLIVPQVLRLVGLLSMERLYWIC